jgi:hypothetical protein
MNDTLKDHTLELLFVVVLVMLLSFVAMMQHVHNDSLASKGMDFVYGDLGALWGLAQRKNANP